MCISNDFLHQIDSDSNSITITEKQGYCTDDQVLVIDDHKETVFDSNVKSVNEQEYIAKFFKNIRI